MKGKVTPFSTAAWCRVVAAIVVILSTKGLLLAVVQWEKVKGWEAYFVAKAIAEGEGYSFPSKTRWLFESVTDGLYYPTSWVDPLYTFILAGMIWAFGDYHQLAAVIFNLLLYVAVFVLVYYLSERLLSSKWAVFTTVLLAVSGFSSMTSNMNNTYLATCLVVLSAVMLLKYFDQPDFRRAMLLGLVLGITVLGFPGAQLFIPITAISIIYWGRQDCLIAVKNAFCVLVVVAIVMAPWVVRNYIVFDEFVPVRSGAGQLAFVGVVASAATVVPEKVSPNLMPGWKEETPRKAILEIYYDNNKRMELEKLQMEYASKVDPMQWSGMNEPQRDKWFLGETKDFILENPLVSMQLAIAKIEVFVRVMGWYGVVIMFLAIIGVLVNLKNPVVTTLGLWAGSYIGPFSIFICYFDKYRAPIEPLLTLLAVYAIYSFYIKYNLRSMYKH